MANLKDCKPCKLPPEIVSKITLYVSHPCADMIKMQFDKRRGKVINIEVINFTKKWKYCGRTYVKRCCDENNIPYKKSTHTKTLVKKLMAI